MKPLPKNRSPKVSNRIVFFFLIVSFFFQINPANSDPLSDNTVGWVQENIFARKETIGIPEKKTIPSIPPHSDDAGENVEGRLPEKKPIPSIPPQMQKDESEKEMLVVVATAGLRKEPGAQNELFFQLRGAEKTKLLETADNWLMVKLDSGQTGWIHRNYVAPAQEAESAGKSESATIKAIGGDVSDEKQETVKILLDRFFPPETFVLEGDNPRIVCDFFNAVPHPDIESEMVLKGDCIVKVRMGPYEHPEKKVRIVLDLVPDNHYEVQQIFYEAENLYCITVGKN